MSINSADNVYVKPDQTPLAQIVTRLACNMYGEISIYFSYPEPLIWGNKTIITQKRLLQ